MERPTDELSFPIVGLSSTVFAATGIAALVGVSLRQLPFVLDIDITSMTILLNSLIPILHGLFPLVCVYLYIKYTKPIALSPWLVGIISLSAAILGRYIGNSLGYVLLGRSFPSPLVLVSSADLVVGEFGIMMWTGVLIGVLGTGLWGVMGAFAGIGLAQVLSPETGI